MRKAMLLIAALILGGMQPPPSESVRIERAMVDAEPNPTKESAAGGYARLTSIGRADTLIGVRCDCARDVDLHRIVREPKPDMLVKQTLALPADVPVDIRPGSDWHFWVGDLQRPLRDGETVILVLRFDIAGEVPVPFTVRASTKDAWAALDPKP